MKVFFYGRFPPGVRPRIRRMLAGPPFPPEAEVSLKVVAPRTMAQYNTRYHGVSGPTDVLSFPYEGPRDGAPYLGDVLLCPAYIAEVAKQEGVPFERHFLRVAAHGVLHLLGMDHQDPPQEREMRAWEERLLERAYAHDG